MLREPFTRLLNPDKWVKAIDFFIPLPFHQDPELTFRSRTLIGFSLLLVSLLFGAFVYISLFAPIQVESVLLAFFFTAGLILVYLALLFILKHTGQFLLCTNLVIASAWIALTSSTFVTGGPTISTTHQIFVVVPLMAFCIGGMRVGLLWSLVVFSTHLYTIGLELIGYPFYQSMDMAHLPVHNFINWSVSFFAVIGLVLVYELTTKRLRFERDREHQLYVYLANHDPLTHLANRNQFEGKLRDSIAQAQRNRNTIALLYIDLDGFKPINDQYGHDAGDDVLQEVANRIRTSLRKKDLVARIGGDEFAAILDIHQRFTDLAPVTRKVLSEIATPVEYEGHQLQVTASIGISLYPDTASSFEELKRQADEAMYHSKSNNNHWTIWPPPRH